VATLSIRITKRADGGATLRCEREDGSAAWQSHRGSRAAFFPMHDLAHFAIGTT
jgi:hypothetical protein